MCVPLNVTVPSYIPKIPRVNGLLNCSQFVGYLAAYRVCMPVAGFFLILAVTMICVRSSKDPRSYVQNGFWLIKWLFVIGLVVAFFFIPDGSNLYFSRGTENWIKLYCIKRGLGLGRCQVHWIQVCFSQCGCYLLNNKWRNTGRHSWCPHIVFTPYFSSNVGSHVKPPHPPKSPVTLPYTICCACVHVYLQPVLPVFTCILSSSSFQPPWS